MGRLQHSFQRYEHCFDKFVMNYPAAEPTGYQSEVFIRPKGLGFLPSSAAGGLKFAWNLERIKWGEQLDAAVYLYSGSIAIR